MKKVSIFMMGMMASGLASAVQLTGTGGSVQRVGACEALLNEDVRVNLTSGVVAGVHCNNSRIVIATCHTGGRQTSRSAQVIEACDTAQNPDCEDTVTTTTVTGPAMAYATTLRGTVITGYPAGTCSAAAAETYAGAQQ